METNKFTRNEEKRMYDYIITFQDSSEAYLVHHGIKGQKWGVRRYQNKDGSYTSQGKDRRLDKVAKTATRVAVGLGLGTSASAATKLAIEGRKVINHYKHLASKVEWRTFKELPTKQYALDPRDLKMYNNNARDFLTNTVKAAHFVGGNKTIGSIKDAAYQKEMRDIALWNVSKALRNDTDRREGYDTFYLDWDELRSHITRGKETLASIVVGFRHTPNTYGKLIKTGAITAASALAAYGAYKLGTKIADNKKENKNKEG